MTPPLPSLCWWLFPHVTFDHKQLHYIFISVFVHSMLNFKKVYAIKIHWNYRSLFCRENEIQLIKTRTLAIHEISSSGVWFFFIWGGGWGYGKLLIFLVINNVFYLQFKIGGLIRYCYFLNVWRFMERVNVLFLLCVVFHFF